MAATPPKTNMSVLSSYWQVDLLACLFGTIVVKYVIEFPPNLPLPPQSNDGVKPPPPPPPSQKKKMRTAQTVVQLLETGVFVGLVGRSRDTNI